MNSIILPGMSVVCLDDDSIETVVSKDRSYVVREVIERGALIKLQGVAMTLASTRFIALGSLPPMEMTNAGN